MNACQYARGYRAMYGSRDSRADMTECGIRNPDIIVSLLPRGSLLIALFCETL